MGTRLFTALALTLSLLAACGAESDERGSPTPTTAPSGTTPAQTAGDITIGLLKTLPGDNVVLGPHTVDMVLSMALAGARGETAEELRKILGHDVPASVPGSRESDGMVLDLAARFWLDESFEPLPDYRRALEDAFKAEPRTADFRKAPDKAVDAINKDVSDITRGKIPKLLARLSEDTRLVLVSAAYMDAEWQLPFNPNSTRADSFTLADGQTASVPTMRAKGNFRRASGSGWRAVELPYKDNRTSMLVIVPDDVGAFQDKLDKAAIAQIDGALDDTLVNLSMPKFEHRTSESLVDALKSLGATAMFDDRRADFSGIADPAQAPLVVSQVQHEAWVKVNEKGTEAAAATGMAVEATAAPVKQPEVFKVDRPFLFLIRDAQSGATLFAGRISDPR